MDVDYQPSNEPAPSINPSTDIFQLDVGGFPSTSTILKVVGSSELANRIAFDVVAPVLSIQRGKVYLGKHFLFSIEEQPLIAQLIFLKNHIVPENFQFFVQWISCIHGMAADIDGRNILFAGSDGAELWFSQVLPKINMDNPMTGVLSTLQLAKIGK